MVNNKHNGSPIYSVLALVAQAMFTQKIYIHTNRQLPTAEFVTVTQILKRTVRLS